ncbi:hypothetical protein PHO31112_02902 [Pandoraea horticolens]|uniref:Uncharacterized protein n=1 Tax=Pandoraea horticolens TaxID=2508298 RepID=A0A5E4VZ28_9BURK|nr:hypothetical protein [Pandoraea horticolens]VVE16534.1 hypothetical protein PHO31112_02902 [Pandoraea horticolens]
MREQTTTQRPPMAEVPAMRGANALDTGIPATLQHAVTMGVMSADAWMFDCCGRVRLHDHIVQSLRFFTAVVSAGMAADGRTSVAEVRANEDAFTAGYMGRIQQFAMVGGYEASSASNVH